jgi:hypothetical protein
LLATVRGGEVLVRADRDDAGGIDVVVGDVVVALDVVKIDGARDAVDLIEVPEVAEKIRVVDNPPDIAFEVAVVHGIEANERDE